MVYTKAPLDIKEAIKASCAAESQDIKVWGIVPVWFRQTVGPLFLIFAPPYFVLFFWHVVVELEGSATALLGNLRTDGAGYLGDIIPSPVEWGAWKYILGFG